MGLVIHFSLLNIYRIFLKYLLSSWEFSLDHIPSDFKPAVTKSRKESRADKYRAINTLCSSGVQSTTANTNTKRTACYNRYWGIY